MLDFAERHAVAHEICGKVVVATQESEVPSLSELGRRGLANGLTGIKSLSAKEIRDREPHCNGVAGLYVPQTGIIDYRSVAQNLLTELLSRGVSVNLGVCVFRIKELRNVVRLETSAGGFETAQVITCAGLQSDRITAESVHDLDVQIIPFRGEYYTLRPDAHRLVRNLIYPVPNPAFPFLGVHFTRMISGGVECGPNAVLAFAREGYQKSDFNFGDVLETLSWPGFRKVARKYWRTGVGEMYRSASKRAFTRALQRLVPEISASDLVVTDAGIRAQACDRHGALVDDFAIRRTQRVLNVVNAPSPAATASFAIARYLVDELTQTSAV
jgi:L-2-hydroxyglutarate oxidase